MRRVSTRLLAPLSLLALSEAYPLGRLLLSPVFPALAPPQAVVAFAPAAAYLVRAVFNSTRIGVETGLAALVPAFLIAFILERRDWRAGPVLAGCLWALVLTPSYLLTTGWQILMASPPLRDSGARTLFYSEVGIVGLLALKGLPFAVLTARAGWRLIGGEVGAAARVNVPSRLRRLRITAGLLAPVATAAFAIVFVEGIGDFGVAATLGAQLHLPLVVYDIYARLSRTPVDFIQAARLAWALILLAALAVAVHRVASRNAPSLVSGRSRPASRPVPSRWEAVGASGLLALVGLLAIGAPGAALLTQAVRNGAATTLSAGELASLASSTGYAFVGATVAVGAAAALLSLVGRGAAASQGVDALTLGAMAVPALVLGASYVIAFNGVLPLYGAPVLLLAGYVVTHLPVLMRLLEASLRSGHASLTDAARLHGLGALARLERIHLPLLLQPLLWAWSLAFGSIFFELPLSALLHPADRTPVGVQLLSLDETLRFAAEARLAASGGAICAAVVGFATLVLPRWLAVPAARDADAVAAAPQAAL